MVRPAGRVQLRRQQYRQRHLVKLASAPVTAPVGEIVLRPAAVAGLRSDEVVERAQRVVDLPDRDHRERRLHRVARPDEMVSAGVVVAVAPRHAQAGDDRAGIGAVLMHLDDGGRQFRFARHARRRVRQRQRPGPVLPLFDEDAPRFVVVVGKAGSGECSRAFRRFRETERQCAGRGRDLAHQRDIAVRGMRIRPCHRAVAGEILPSVGKAGIADAGAREAGIAAQAQRRSVVAGEEILAGERAVVARARQMRREQGIETKSVAVQRVADHQHIAQRMDEKLQLEPEAVAFVNDTRQRHAGLRCRDRIAVRPLEFRPAVRTGDDEAEVADLRMTGRRPVNLVDDAVPEGRPDTARSQRRRDGVLGA